MRTKNLLALVLVLTMIFSGTPVPSFAGSGTGTISIFGHYGDFSATEFDYAITDLSDAPIASGTTTGLQAIINAVPLGDYKIDFTIPAGYYLSGWSLGSSTFSIVEDGIVDIEPNFDPLPSHQITFSAGGFGVTSITATVDGTPINSGDNVQQGKTIEFTAAGAANNTIDKWQLNGVDDNTNLSNGGLTKSVVVGGPFSIFAVFKPATYAYEFRDYNNNVVSSGTIGHGGSPVAPILPDKFGVQFDAWSQDPLLGITAPTVFTPVTSPIPTQSYVVDRSEFYNHYGIQTQVDILGNPNFPLPVPPAVALADANNGVFNAIAQANIAELNIGDTIDGYVVDNKISNIDTMIYLVSKQFNVYHVDSADYNAYLLANMIPNLNDPSDRMTFINSVVKGNTASNHVASATQNPAVPGQTEIRSFTDAYNNVIRVMTTLPTFTFIAVDATGKNLAEVQNEINLGTHVVIGQTSIAYESHGNPGGDFVGNADPAALDYINGYAPTGDFIKGSMFEAGEDAVVFFDTAKYGYMIQWDGTDQNLEVYMLYTRPQLNINFHIFPDNYTGLEFAINQVQNNEMDYNVQIEQRPLSMGIANYAIDTLIEIAGKRYILQYSGIYSTQLQLDGFLNSTNFNTLTGQLTIDLARATNLTYHFGYVELKGNEDYQPDQYVSPTAITIELLTSRWTSKIKEVERINNSNAIIERLLPKFETSTYRYYQYNDSKNKWVALPTIKNQETTSIKVSPTNLRSGEIVLIQTAEPVYNDINELSLSDQLAMDLMNGLGLYNGYSNDRDREVKPHAELTANEFYTVVARLLGSMPKAEGRLYDIAEYKTGIDVELYNFYYAATGKRIDRWVSPYMSELVRLGIVSKTTILKQQLTQKDMENILMKAIKLTSDADHISKIDLLGTTRLDLAKTLSLVLADMDWIK